MTSMIKTIIRINRMLTLLVSFVFVLHQAFAYPGIILKSDNCIPSKFQKNRQEEWLQKWTSENIGKGFFQPKLESEEISKKSNNVLEILMNKNDEFLIDNQFIEIGDVKQVVINYLHGINPGGKKGPDYAEKNITSIGKTKVSKGMITYKHDLASPVEMVNFTLNCIGEAFLEVRNEKAQALFGNDYFNLDDEKQSAITEATPIWFFYEMPKSPTPSVWLPYDEKPSKPDPFKITFKGNGNVVVENHKFKTFEEFEENLSYWNEELEKLNKNQRIKAYYRAIVAFENISVSEQKDIDYLLYKSNVRVEKTNTNIGSKTYSIVLSPDNIPDLKKLKKDAENDLKIYSNNLKVIIQYAEGVTEEEVKSVINVYLELGIRNIEVREYENKKPSPPMLLLRLYPNEIRNVFNEVMLQNSVPEYVESWLKKAGTEYTAGIYVYQDVSEEQIEQLKQEMLKGGIKTEIIVKKI